MQGNGHSYTFRFSISGDGRYVTFWSDASNLVPDDTNGFKDVFIHDRETHTTTLVSKSFDGTDLNGDAAGSSLSGDGRYAMFYAWASSLVPDDTNVKYDVFVHQILNVSPNEPPMADAGPDQTIEQESYAGVSVTLDGSGSSDPDDDPLTYSWTWAGGLATGVSPTIMLPLGLTTITLVVNDSTVDSEPDTVDITVVDTTPPEVVCELVPIEVEEDEGMFEVQFDVVDICTPDPLVEVVIVCDGLEIPVSYGEYVNIELDDECEVEYEDEVMEIEGPNTYLLVTAIDLSNNVGICTTDAPFIPDDDDDDDDD